ncbi:hypothetical protein HUK45_08780 [Limosilactobacillus sp. c9Ua_26_M]|uniref:Uncharacterized protein n=1 Tax=Limosilactobacillus urinaemulieris TaxID=2742600 RepID=A0ABR8ZLY5_9LACO|nr:hypothetical protein [Limosilactobacillus urinaemulieris]MBD8086311.1 hypothetical protein [Limosilactobacillus urinaemulieris]
MILADITVSLKNPLFSVDHIIAFVGIILNIGTLVFAIYSNHKANVGTSKRQGKLEEHQGIIENTQKEISSNLNSTAKILGKINGSIEKLNKEQEELANRISNIQVVMLQSEYKNFFSELSNHNLHVRNLLIIIDEYKKDGSSPERNDKFRYILEEFQNDFIFFARYNVEHKIKESFPQMLALSFDKLYRKYEVINNKIDSINDIFDCFEPIQDYSRALGYFLEKVSAK